ECCGSLPARRPPRCGKPAILAGLRLYHKYRISQFEHRAWPCELEGTCKCAGEARAARIGGSNVQRFLQPEAKKDCRACGRLITATIGSRALLVGSCCRAR